MDSRFHGNDECLLEYILHILCVLANVLRFKQLPELWMFCGFVALGFLFPHCEGACDGCRCEFIRTAFGWVQSDPRHSSPGNAGRMKRCEGATATEEVLLGCGHLMMIRILPDMDSRFHGNDEGVRE